MLEETYNSYRALADEINWQEYNSNDLFFEYIKHENEPIAEKFYAAIVCRYWGYTGRLYLQCNKRLPFEQCYDILIDTINYVLEKRVWENENNSMYQDSKGPDKAFHIVLKRQRAVLLANLNAYKRRTNVNTLSIDEIHEKYSDAAEGLFEIYDTSENIFSIVDFIKSRVDTLSIIILDKICFSEWASLKKVIKLIKNLNESDYEYYNINYGISLDKYHQVIKEIGAMNNSRLLFETKKLLYLIENELL